MADMKDRAREYLRSQTQLNGGGLFHCNILNLMLGFAEQELKEVLKSKRCNCMTYLNFKDLEKENTELEAQIEKMKCCGNCKKLKSRFDSKTNINILYCSDSDMRQIEVGFQMCCCKWEIKEK